MIYYIPTAIISKILYFKILKFFEQLFFLSARVLAIGTRYLLTIGRTNSNFWCHSWLEPSLRRGDRVKSWTRDMHFFGHLRPQRAADKALILVKSTHFVSLVSPSSACVGGTLPGVHLLLEELSLALLGVEQVVPDERFERTINKFSNVCSSKTVSGRT